MSKAVKDLITNELRRRYDGVDSACVVDISGMTVPEQESLRSALREKSARLAVIKNRLARRAWKDTVLAPLGVSLKGPCALVTTSASLIDAAKTLVAAAKEHEALTLRDAMVEGDPELVSVERLATMKGRHELIGEVAVLVTSPGSAIAGCMLAPQSRIAGCLKAMVEKAA